MKIMILTNSAWDDTNASNTFTNLFSDWKDAKFSNVYTRENMPNNPVCNKYFCITDKMLAKCILTPSKIGREFTHLQSDGYNDYDNKKRDVKEEKLISFIHKYNLKFAYHIENILWRLRGWQNKNFKNFLQHENPDIIFTFAIPTIQRTMMLRYVKENTNAKIVLFLVDHVCSKYFSNNKEKGYIERKRLAEQYKLSEKNYGISEELCNIYGTEFGVKITPLYKGCDFNVPVKKNFNKLIKIVYAGNLLYGRLNTLAELVNTINNINKNEQKYSIEIYSGTDISKIEADMLNIPGTSKFCGKRNFEEIKKILTSADIVLHIESFENEQIERVRYSFSTKIIDCLQSGNVLAAIGPKVLSSIKYCSRIDGSIVVDDLKKLEEVFLNLSTDSLKSRAESIREFALKNHSMDVVHNSLKTDFNEII